MMRWSEFLAAYNYELIYWPGKNITHADALSHSPLPELDDDPAPTISTLHIKTLANLPITATDIAEETARDRNLVRILNWVVKGWPETKSDETVKPFWHRQTELSILKGCVLWGDRVIILDILREQILKLLHDGHPCIVRMKSLARSYVWWPGMDTDIGKWVAMCKQYQESRPAPPSAPTLDWETPRGPWSRIHIDFAGPTKGHTFLIVVDAYSNWLEVSIMHSTTTEAVIRQLRKLFAMHGLPDLVVSDNGPQFTALTFERFLAEQGIRHALTALGQPATKGRAERTVRYTKKTLYKLESGDIQEKIYKLLMIQHIVPNTTTNKSPAELLMGRKLRSSLDRLHPTYRCTLGGKGESLVATSGGFLGLTGTLGGKGESLVVTSGSLLGLEQYSCFHSVKGHQEAVGKGVAEAYACIEHLGRRLVVAGGCLGCPSKSLLISGGLLSWNVILAFDGAKGHWKVVGMDGAKAFAWVGSCI
ncbi:uncharacterized protein K02A2.6-like [Pseudonaja textilis]|uniref:uncharacterized protein K02A2.6-like n=1 Tax=Pseudonaja textilis TaxID=8673 RepID=UPI000EA99314|nr:uncharacterized protein K02A2.6-like [Pseudonaja textilis]